MLEKATAQEVKIAQLNSELAAIQAKKTDRESKLAELAARKAKAKADIEESLKRNDETRQDAISLTDYQKKELADVESREATIIQQFDADTEQINKAIADLRARRETELARATKWNAEEARIDNAYKAKMADYENKKAAYEKAKAEYDNANFLKRQLMKEPVDPGVPPVREDNTILKPTEIAEIDAQIKAKEAELVAVNNKRRDGVAQVEADARQLREEFDTAPAPSARRPTASGMNCWPPRPRWTHSSRRKKSRSTRNIRRPRRRLTGFARKWTTHRTEGRRVLRGARAAIKNTQVYRIATTVEIVRGLFMGQRPVSIKATAKERGDLYTDQISMVRIWVYPVLAFIVAFLPTLMVEIGFSTLFEPEKQRPQHRLGFPWPPPALALHPRRSRERFCAPNAWPEKRPPRSPPATRRWPPRKPRRNRRWPRRKPGWRPPKRP